MEGYNQLSVLLATYPDLCIFRRFLTLHVRNVLHLQAELQREEGVLQRYIVDDSASDDPKTRNFQFNISVLIDSANDDTKNDQWEQTLRTRSMLRIHTEAIRDLKYCLSLSPANKADLHALRDFLFRSKKRNPAFLRGREASTWEPEHDHDLTSLNSPPLQRAETDILSKWIGSTVAIWYHKLVGSQIHKPISLAQSAWNKAASRAKAARAREQDIESCAGTDCSSQTAVEDGETDITAFEMIYYANSKATAFVNIISCIVSPLLPTVGIAVLFKITSQGTRIGVIMAFTFVFSLAVTLMTRARRIDSFTATAAFAAVLVVSVSTGAGGGGGRS